MRVIEFKYLTRNDLFDKKYVAWSRIYEYPYVLNMLKKLGANKNSMIHNTSWGWEGCHVTFKNDLDDIYRDEICRDEKSRDEICRNEISRDEICRDETSG